MVLASGAGSFGTLVTALRAALAWRDAEHDDVAAFRAAFPHLAPLLAREREWASEPTAESGAADEP